MGNAAYFCFMLTGVLLILGAPDKAGFALIIAAVCAHVLEGTRKLPIRPPPSPRGHADPQGRRGAPSSEDE